jgi:hypothetical protein
MITNKTKIKLITVLAGLIISVPNIYAKNINSNQKKFEPITAHSVFKNKGFGYQHKGKIIIKDDLDNDKCLDKITFSPTKNGYEVDIKYSNTTSAKILYNNQVKPINMILSTGENIDYKNNQITFLDRGKLKTIEPNLMEKLENLITQNHSKLIDINSKITDNNDQDVKNTQLQYDVEVLYSGGIKEYEKLSKLYNNSKEISQDLGNRIANSKIVLNDILNY